MESSLMTNDEREEDIAELEELDTPLEEVRTPGKLALFENNPFPVLLIDSKLRIIMSNSACSKLFSEFYHLEGQLFSDVFAQALGPTALRQLRNAVHNGDQSYSWKGLIRSKARSTGTILTKAYLFPLYSEQDKKPEDFIVLFDDVTEENKSLLRSVFLSLLEASKLKDNDTGKHIQRVNLYSKQLAETLFDQSGYAEVDKDFIDDIAFLAAMHDVGKIGTPDDILNKEGPLEEWEWSIMKEHTKNGAYILSTYPTPMAREIALYHHERWDGSGYPYRLEGSMIPLAARIVSLADVYDALRMRRSYKHPFDHRTSLNKIIEWRGTHFDPALVDKLMSVHEKMEAIYEDNAD